jgi:hypothetical protein
MLRSSQSTESIKRSKAKTYNGDALRVQELS